MPASGKVLEDSIRLSRIRKIKLALYMVQAVMLVVLAIVMVFVVGGAALKPVLYIPLDSFLAVVVLLFLIICLESFFFRLLEIRFARSSSARHLMAKNSMKRAIMIVIITGIFAAILAVPAIRGAIESAGSSSSNVTAASTPPAFWSSDPFALVSSVQVEVTASLTVQVYLLDDEIFDQYYGTENAMSAMYSFRLNRENYVVNDKLTIDVPNQGYIKYHVVVNDMDNPGASATVEVVKEMSSTFTGIISLLLIAFVVANIAWFAYLIPIERKYSAGSIYK